MPLTSLAAQLKKLETPQTRLLVPKKDKPSFLFDTKEAAKFDRDKIYELGISGLEELKTLNPNFGAFDSTLFDVTSKTFERAVQTSEVNEKLNDQIRTFLTLLSPYFLLKPAHKALEWLINRYHIEEFNVDDVMFLILPYHETILFAQMLRVLWIDRESGRWHWLYTVKKERVPLSKTVLLSRAAKDMAFLKFVCDMPAQAIKIHGSRASCLGTLFAFYCTTVIGGLQYAEPIGEVHITHILPSLLTGLSSVLQDYTASTFMIIARLATKTCLSPKIITVLFNKISKVEHTKLRSETTLVLVLLCQNNEAKCEFPEKAAARLAETRWFVPCLATLSKTGVLINPFVKLLLSTCLKLVQSGQDLYKPLVESILTDVKFDEENVDDIFKTLLEEFSNDSNEELTKWFSELLKGLEHSFPKVFDAVVSAALSDEESKPGLAVKRILGINTSRNDLFLKLVHPNEDVRLQAIKHIGKHFEPDQLAWLNQTLLDRLRDDSPKVVRQVLRLSPPLIATLQSDTLINNLISVIARFGESDEPIVIQALNILLQHSTAKHDSLFLIVFLPHVMSVLYKSKIIEEAPEGRLPFLSALKKYAAKETKATYVLWKTLLSADNVPSVEEIITSLNEWKSLKKHSSFWFSSSLLIGSKMTDHPSQETGDLIMEYLIEYLKFPEVMSVENIEILNAETLEPCLEVCLKGKLPIHGALHCLSVLSQCIRHLSSKKPWIDMGTKSNAFTMSMFKVLHEGCNSEKKSVRIAFSHARASFFQNHFAETESQALFLINALILDPSFGYKCLDLVIKILSSDANILPSILKEHSLIIPALLILLSSPVEGIRARALEVFSLFSGLLSTGFYRPLVDELVSHSTEILLDNEQILIVAYKELSPSDEVRSLLKESVAKSMESILHHLVTIITNNATPPYIKAHLLHVLQFVQSKDVLLELLPLASTFLGTDEKLDESESKVLVFIYKRLKESVADILKDERFWNHFKIALGDHKTQLEHPDFDKGICPAALILNQITKEFFQNIPEPKYDLQKKLLSVILEKVTDVDNVQVMSANSLFFKRISLEAKMLVSLLTPMLNIFVPYSPCSSLRARQRKSASGLPSLETLETFEWKSGVCLLELIQNKKKVTDIHLLLPMLFSLLKKCLQFEQQAPVEYTKQLLLSSILHCCEKLSNVSKDSVPLDSLQVDVVVECVRASHNPQTHHHALLALSYIAHLLPEQVLHNIMAIFTFIGSSIVRQDDAYSFQLISKIIETVIPILVKSQEGAELEEAVTNVLRVFVSTILDVPEHRRIPLFKKLLITLNNGEFIWIFLCLIFEKHVLNFSNVPAQDAQDKQEGNSAPKVLKYGLQLCGEFPPSVLLNTLNRLLEYISKLPNDKDTAIQEKFKEKKFLLIFNIEQNSGKNFRHYKYTLLTFLSSLMSSQQFVQQIGELSEEETKTLKEVFSSIVENCLIYIKKVTVQIEKTIQSPTSKYWKVVLNQCYDILDKANALLPTDAFIEVVGQLLKHSIDAVRRKAMELLGWRLQQPMPLPEDDLRGLLEPLVSTLDSVKITNESKDEQESQITLQAALFALKLMARHLSSKYLSDFKQVLQKVAEILGDQENMSGPVVGSLILCLGELVATLKAQSIEYLPKFMPSLISILHKSNTDDVGGDLLLLSAVTSVQKIVETLAQFLSPYLEKLLFEISILSSKYDAEMSDNQQKSQSLSFKLKAIRQKISNDVPTRVLVPAVSSAHSRLMKHGRYQAIGPLMSVLSDRFTSSSDLSTETVQLFLTALEFRGSQPEPSLQESDAVETPVIKAFTSLILKLSESSFRPLYQRVFDWATRKKAQKERIITFYRLSKNIAKSLRSLFSLFVGIFIENAAEMLTLNNLSKRSESWFKGDFASEKSLLLVENIIETFLVTFSHDSQKFLTKEYFNVLLDPLVDQLENRIGDENIANERCKNLLTPCLAEMANSTGDDSLWKRLNHSILLKTRHSSPEVRIIGLRTTCAIAAKLGEDFMPLLPETVPFLAELLEDDVEEVEKECQKIVNEMEEILGESIQKYF